MSKADKVKHNAADYDLRVRERNLHRGVLDQKVVDKYLHDLPDLESQTDDVLEPQPSLVDPDD